MKNIPSVIDGIEFVVNGQIKVTSKEISEKFGKNHRDVLKAIRNIECSENFGLRNFAPSEYKNEQNKKQPCFNVTEKGFMFLVMGFTGKEAAAWKEKFIAAFEAMKEYIVAEEQRKLIRKQSAMNAPEMTGALLQHRNDQNKTTKPFHYSNEFDMINRIVLGVSKKKWCEHEEIQKDNFRDALTPVQIEAVENLQTANTVLIETGMEYKTRKDKLEKIFEKKFAKRCLDETVKLNA